MTTTTDQETHMTTTTPAAGLDLGDRLRRLTSRADAVPPVHRTAVAIHIDRLEALLGLVVDEAPAVRELELEDQQ